MYRILLVEDDPVITKVVQQHLTAWQYEVSCVENFQQVVEEFTAVRPQLVLMDVTLPFFNGFYWCAQIRRISSVPIIFLTSASDKVNLVMAMNMGADDFLAKPFDLDVLTAKIGGMLRRTYEFSGENDIIEYKGVILDLNDCLLLYDRQRLELTKNEFRILHTLMENRGRVVSRETIMQRLWESDSFIDDNTLTVNVNRLRRKLEQAGLRDFIATKKGMGYAVE